MNIKTNVTIISTNLNKGIVANFPDYHLVDDSFKLEDLYQYPKIIFFNVFAGLTQDEIEEIYLALNTKGISFINVTNNIEEVLYTKYLIIYDKEQVLIEGETLEVLKEEKLIKRIGLTLPFMVHLSLLLKDYNLIDKIYLDKESLVKELWK